MRTGLVGAFNYLRRAKRSRYGLEKEERKEKGWFKVRMRKRRDKGMVEERYR